jgi:tetraacyldisaccharide 4'-kinase
LALLYGWIIALRNWLFDKQILRSSTFNFPLICVGNLALGGTGKTPMTAYIVSFLKNNYRVATLSRGYKRKTKGFALADAQTSALEIGDEPMLFHQRFPDVTVAVGEERLVAIPQLLHARPDTEVIILDDAFQHRYVQAGLNILLTEYRNLYTRDLMFPAGDLRDVRSSSKRANIIVVTKCPPELSPAEKNMITEELKPTAAQTVYFTTIAYDLPYHLITRQARALEPDIHLLLITGIANPKPLKDYLVSRVQGYDMMRFADHHIFSSVDLADIKKQFARLPEEKRLILTTEKDAVRLEKFGAELADLPIYVIPIQHQFLFDDAARFHRQLQEFIRSIQPVKASQ